MERDRRSRLYLRDEIGDTPTPDTVQWAERIKTDERPCMFAEWGLLMPLRT